MITGGILCSMCGKPLKKKKLPWWKKLLLRVEYSCPDCDALYAPMNLEISGEKGKPYSCSVDLVIVDEKVQISKSAFERLVEWYEKSA